MVLLRGFVHLLARYIALLSMTMSLLFLCPYAHSAPPGDYQIAMRHQEAYKLYEIGLWTYGSPKIYSWGESATLKIGNYCSIGDGVAIMLGGEHRTDWVTTYPFNMLWSEGAGIEGHPATKGDVVIGHDVWIGQEAYILSGVHIGNGAVIAARSVVTKDVEPYSIVGGVPAKRLRYRFSPSIIEQLQKIAWWNWPEEDIAAAIPYLLSQDIEKFILYFGSKPSSPSGLNSKNK